MATGEIVPDADITIQWFASGSPAEGEIDESHASPNILDYIQASQALGHDNLICEFHCSSISDVGEATSVIVYTYAEGIATFGGHADVDFSPDGTNWEGYQAMTFAVGSWGWHQRIFPGLSMSQADLNACRVRFRANVPISKQAAQIACVYLVVTYTAPSGYGHDYMGVPAANIDNVCGVPTANIASIKGV